MPQHARAKGAVPAGTHAARRLIPRAYGMRAQRRPLQAGQAFAY